QGRAGVQRPGAELPGAGRAAERVRVPRRLLRAAERDSAAVDAVAGRPADGDPQLPVAPAKGGVSHTGRPTAKAYKRLSNTCLCAFGTCGWFLPTTCAGARSMLARRASEVPSLARRANMQRAYCHSRRAHHGPHPHTAVGARVGGAAAGPA